MIRKLTFGKNKEIGLFLLINLLIMGCRLETRADDRVLELMPTIYQNYRRNDSFIESRGRGAVILPGDKVQLILKRKISTSSHGVVPAPQDLFKILFVKKTYTVTKTANYGFAKLVGFRTSDKIRVSPSELGLPNKKFSQIVYAELKGTHADEGQKLVPSLFNISSCQPTLFSIDCIENSLKNATHEDIYAEYCLLTDQDKCADLIRSIGHYDQKNKGRRTNKKGLFVKIYGLYDFSTTRTPILTAALEWTGDDFLNQLMSIYQTHNMLSTLQGYITEKSSINRVVIFDYILKRPSILRWLRGKDGDYPIPPDLAERMSPSQRNQTNLEGASFGALEDYYSRSHPQSKSYWSRSDCVRAVASLPKRYKGGRHLNLAMIHAKYANGSMFAECPKNSPGFYRPNGKGDTVLHFAARHAQLAYLLGKHTDLNLGVKNKAGETPVDLVKTGERSMKWRNEEAQLMIDIYLAVQSSIKSKQPIDPKLNPCYIEKLENSRGGRLFKKNLCEHLTKSSVKD